MRIALPLAALGLAACSSGGGGGAPAGNVFGRCAACHNAEPGGPNGLGPNLYGVVGRKAASLPNFNYSPAMRVSGLTWDEATLDRFLTNPQKAVPGTRMSFAGVPDPAQRREIIRSLRKQGGQP